MDGISAGPWQIYLIVVLALLGTGVTVHGLRLLAQGLGSSSPDSATLLTALRGFRVAVIGLALVGVAGAWQWGEVWLLVLSLGIAGEETVESSVMIWALEQERRRPGAGQRRRRLPPRHLVGSEDGLPTRA